MTVQTNYSLGRHLNILLFFILVCKFLILGEFYEKHRLFIFLVGFELSGQLFIIIILHIVLHLKELFYIYFLYLYVSYLNKNFIQQ
jgi:hypothetical protein